MTLTLEALDAAGGRLGVTSGFFLGPELVSTSLAGINGARTVRLVAPDGRHLQTSLIVGWDVREDWAVLRFPGAEGEPPPRAEEPPRVGERAYILDSQGAGDRVIIETAFIGASPDGDFRTADFASEATNGAPVLNEYGEVMATLAGSGILGTTGSDLLGLGSRVVQLQSRGSRARVPVTVSDLRPSALSLEELEKSGVFVRSVVRTPHFVSGVMGTSIDKQGPVPLAADQRFTFSRTDSQCVVFVTWNPTGKEDSTSHFVLFDEVNRRLGATDPAKLKLRSGKPFVQYWTIPLAALKPGLYRVDLMLGADPVWRTFFRLDE
jgi:hypothetical protein